MLHTKMRSPNENIMSCARSFVTYEMCSVLTYGAHETFYVRTYVIHVNMMFLGQNDDTYDTVICPNLCYPRKYDVFCPNVRYIRKWVMMSRVLLMLRTNCVRYTRIPDYFLSVLMLQTKMCNVQTCYTRV